jgi:hypothetical protein
VLLGVSRALDQKSIVFFFARNEFNAMTIHQELIVILCAEVVSYPSVTGYFREARFSFSIRPATFSEPDPTLDDSDNNILLTLVEQSFI